MGGKSLEQVTAPSVFFRALTKEEGMTDRFGETN